MSARRPGGRAARSTRREDGLAARRSIYADARRARMPGQVAFEAIAAEPAADACSRSGRGPGELSAADREPSSEPRSSRSTSPPRMVELAAARGVDARVGDVQSLPVRGRVVRLRRGGLDALPRPRPRPRRSPRSRACSGRAGALVAVTQLRSCISRRLCDASSAWTWPRRLPASTARTAPSILAPALRGRRAARRRRLRSRSPTREAIAPLRRASMITEADKADRVPDGIGPVRAARASPCSSRSGMTVVSVAQALC